MSEHAHSHDHKLTKNQQMVFDALSAEGGPLTAYTILDRLRDDGFRAPLQVYRALDKLQAFGLVHRLESLNAFVVCSHQGCAAHQTAAFAICENCGRVHEFSPEQAMDLLKGWAKEQGFVPTKATIELRGTCSECEPKPDTH